ncbi:hypothetical protein HYDPIDRAFT_113215 [Hydnomerulius pinastri MD-312]|uniref:JmjC domain-containing protein n=1 Tax=Hydnomerulius pinastri MD-312 TaxID=994086 RepID=A0A0C9VY66_9AGAM|nr:hypothetical protein HYDPIDRAFT_113215 [Hydnomerulius pinastri MD-312]
MAGKSIKTHIEDLKRLVEQQDLGVEALAEGDRKTGRDFRSAVHQLRDNDDSNPADLAVRIDQFINVAYERMPSSERSASFYWRSLHTDACIAKALVCASTPELHEDVARECISTLDHAIIISGATGEDRMDMIQEIIRLLQARIPCRPPLNHILAPGQEAVHLPPTFRGNVCSIASLPFSVPENCVQTPFVVRKGAADWRAMQEAHQWASLAYLNAVAGPGRIVPVEVGDDYRSDNWTQKLLSWDEFLSSLDPEDHHRHHTLYLAQHNLLTQFPKLWDDIGVPDFVWTSLPPSMVEPIINAWLGPKGTISPAHTDPFSNCYVQVVGRKTVWLAPPDCDVAKSMYPYGPSSTGIVDKTHNPAANAADPLMSNTSRVDVFPATSQAIEASQKEFPRFWDAVPGKALCVTLNPGDLLFFPPKWWHAMRSEDVSFSVSMWF